MVTSYDKAIISHFPIEDPFDHFPLQSAEAEAGCSDTMPLPKELSGSSIMGSRELKLFRQQSSYRFHEWRPWLRAAWACHFAASMLILVWGCMENRGRKYLPVDVTAMDPTMDCSKGFVNVFASSSVEDGALVCCGTEVFDDGICSPPPGILFFARRLSRFPEAWLLPLFPLFLRGVVHMLQQYRAQHQQGSSQSTTPESKAQHRLARRRFYLYLTLIQVRGWILYLLFDEIEALFFSTVDSKCWYERYLYPNYSTCQGRTTDFSDHIVLYFAQILPIPLTEVLHSIVVPFWKENNVSSNSCSSSNTKHPPTRSFMTASIIPRMLVCGMLYLYIITFMGAYKTAVYFHTWPEIWNGYLVSMLVQVPLLLMQCTSSLDNATTYFFGYASS